MSFIVILPLITVFNIILLLLLLLNELLKCGYVNDRLLVQTLEMKQPRCSKVIRS